MSTDWIGLPPSWIGFSQEKLILHVSSTTLAFTAFIIAGAVLVLPKDTSDFGPVPHLF
jgi:hypothetical protein